MVRARVPRSDRERIDILLVKRGLASSRQRAQAYIMEGKVWVNGSRVEKAGVRVNSGVTVDVIGEEFPYVSRGGRKLEYALSHWNIEVKDRIFMDIGASTGGFTDCLLQHGAARVYAIDVGYGQLAWKLRCDERVVKRERSNIRNLTRESFEDEIDGAVIDVSFISLKKVIPKAGELVKDSAPIIALIKPQFEVGRGEVGKGGVVRDGRKHQEVIAEMISFARAAAFTVVGVIESPLMGPRGNKEFFIYLLKQPESTKMHLPAVRQTEHFSTGF